MDRARPLPHCLNRLFEWAMAVALLSMGIHLTIWPEALRASSFRMMTDLFGTGALATYLFLIVGSFRVLALYKNGTWYPAGPHLRAFCAILGAVIWGQMALALYGLIGMQGTPPSPGIPIYSTLVVFELISTYRAATDVKFRH